MSTLGKIGARDMLEHRKFAEDYVQDGLVALWDGKENAGWRTHDSSATSWKNLVGDNYNLSLGSGSWTDNARRHTTRASNGAAYSSSVIPTEQCVHVELVCKITGALGTNGQALLFRNNKAATTTDGYIIIGLRDITTESPYLFVSNRQNSSDKTAVYCSYPPSIRSISYAKTNRGDAFLDGVITPLTIVNYNKWDDAGICLFGRYNTNTYHAYGDIYCCRVYSRALTQEEVTHNHDIDKTRFKLP